MIAVEYIQTELILGLAVEYSTSSTFTARYDPASDQPDPPLPSNRIELPIIPESTVPDVLPDDSNDLSKVSIDTSATSNHSFSVREQVILNTSQIAPEHSHWTEVYWVARGLKKHLYYRYCWMVGRKILRCHIPGGHIHSCRSLSCCQVVREAIASNCSPQEIQNIIRKSRNSAP